MKKTIIFTISARAFIVNPFYAERINKIEDTMRILANCLIDRVLIERTNKLKLKENKTTLIMEH